MSNAIKYKKIDVPFFSQKEDVVKDRYKNNGCGITSLKMSLDYVKGKKHSFESLFKKEMGSFKDGLWLHGGLVKIAKSFGVGAYRIDLSKGFFIFPKTFLKLIFNKASTKEISEFCKKTIKTKKNRLISLKKIIDENSPVILSMSKDYLLNSENSHLIVLIGYTENCFIVHDPWDFGPNHKISFEDFEKYWTGRAIILFKV